MARGGGGGGLIAKQRNQQQGISPPPKLPGQGGGGGGGGRNHPGINHRRPGGLTNVQKNRRQDRRRSRKDEDASLSDPQGPYGPGTDLFNSAENALQGAQGMLMKGGISINPQYQGQSQFLNNALAQDYADFEAMRMGGGYGDLDWTTYLTNKYGPDLPAGMSRSYADSYARASPTARGYFSGGWRGPGRTITG